MNICFYANHPYWSQLNSNGGTSTILKSANSLKSLGHKVHIVATKDKFRWFKHSKPVNKISEDADACIAVTISDIKPMLKYAPKKAKLFYWCRLLENHQMSKRKVLKWASKVKVIVNSENLRDWYANHGIETRIAYQGIDSYRWHNLYIHEKNSIGFLISDKPRKHFDFVMEIVKKLGDTYRYYGYGIDLNKKIKRFVKNNFYSFVKNADYSSLIRIYNVIDTWVVTSTKEGLHNPPMEAALCGCTVVYPDAPLAGCSDHCIDGETAWRYKALDVDSAIKAIKSSDKTRYKTHRELILNKIGNREQAMRNFVEVLKCY